MVRNNKSSRLGNCYVQGRRTGNSLQAQKKYLLKFFFVQMHLFFCHIEKIFKTIFNIDEPNFFSFDQLQASIEQEIVRFKVWNMFIGL